MNVLSVHFPKRLCWTHICEMCTGKKTCRFLVNIWQISLEILLLFLRKGNKPPNTVWHFESKCALESFDLVYGQRHLVTRTRMPFLRRADLLGHFMGTNTFPLCPSIFLIKAGWEAICSLCIWFIVAFICYVWSDEKEWSFSVYVLFKNAKIWAFLKKRIIRYGILCNILHNHNIQQYIVTTNAERLLIKQLSCACALSWLCNALVLDGVISSEKSLSSIFSVAAENNTHFPL